MGFLDKAFKVMKNVGLFAVNELETSTNKIIETKEKYESMSDEDLVRIVQSEGFLSHSKQDKAIAFKILKENGYPIENINSKA